MDARKKIPYGISSYKTIRMQNCYYVDKTRFIPELEKAGDFLFLLRPRRFGKSSLLTVLESYYDITAKDEFEFLFKDTFVGKNPTPEKNSYLILKFNFSQVNPDPAKIEESFRGHVRNRFYFFGEKYARYLDDGYFRMMESHGEAHQKLEFLLGYLGSKGLKAYVLIDEYDNFANTVLTTSGQDNYRKLTHGAGFLRFFFNVLKGGADQADSGLGRMFITGVSPVTMDDVTSGFNIGRNVSLFPEFNELLGFTESDVSGLFEYYGVNQKPSGPEKLLDLAKEWYDGYLFSGEAVEAVFNTDMVWYFVKRFRESEVLPEKMIDQNVRIDYGKLRHLIVLDRRLNGNFGYLSEIVQKQEIGPARIAESFPVEKLLKPSNFISLLFYFGLLSHTRSGRLRIPNRTVKKLMYGYLVEGYEDVDVFKLDLWRFAGLVRAMAFDGDWEPVFRFVAAEVEKQTSVRDYLSGEKVIQTFLLAYLNITDYFVTRAEEEMGKGFADLYLEPFAAAYPDARFGYLIELKYIKRGEYTEEALLRQLETAGRQLAKYAGDPRVAERIAGGNLKCVALVFSGWELMAAKLVDVRPCEEKTV